VHLTFAHCSLTHSPVAFLWHRTSDGEWPFLAAATATTFRRRSGTGLARSRSTFVHLRPRRLLSPCGLLRLTHCCTFSLSFSSGQISLPWPFPSCRLTETEAVCLARHRRTDTQRRHNKLVERAVFSIASTAAQWSMTVLCPQTWLWLWPPLL